MKKKFVTGLALGLMISLGGIAQASLIENGSFEIGTNPPTTGYKTLSATNTDISGWTVTEGNLDWIRTSWEASDGELSLDLVGTVAGKIEQSFSTNIDQQYNVTFDMAGNPVTQGTTELRVEAADQYAVFSFNNSGMTTSNMGWNTNSWIFTAVDTMTTISFMSLGDYDKSGPALDNVDVTEIIPVDFSDGLVAYYPFNGNANDESGNGNDGIVYGATLTTDRFNKTDCAYNFDDVDDYITIWSMSEINNHIDTNKGSISAWFNLSSRIDEQSSFIYQYFSNNNDRLYLDVGDLTDGYGVSPQQKLRFAIGNGYELSNSDISVDQWYHTVLLWQENGEIALYINGEYSGNGEFTNSDFNFQDTESFYLGRGWAGNRGIFAGIIDDIRIYNRNLSESEILELYNENDCDYPDE